MIHLFFGLLFLSQTALWGWMSLVFLAIVIVLPYVYRCADARQPSSTPAASRPYPRLWPHFWLGPAVFLISFIHAWIPMASGKLPQTSMQGLWLATYALGLVFVQLLLGLALRFSRLRSLGILRRVHFVLLLGIVALVLSHLWLNGPFAHTN